MAQRRGVTSSRDVDLLMLIREEETYAGRIRDALVFSESRLERPPAPSSTRDEAIREARRTLYTRPTSVAERTEEVEIYSEPSDVTQCRSKNRSSMRRGVEEPVLEASLPYLNPPINYRKTVDDNDALYSADSVSKGRVEFSYEDLMATKEGRKITTVRALRRLANLWGFNPKLNKDAMLAVLIGEYIRRYPDEVAAYESRKSTMRQGRAKRHPRRRQAF